MARQAGPILLQGTTGGITFYRLEGQYYARSKSSLDRKRVKTDPAFARSRACAQRFGRAAKIAAAAYRQLPAHRRKHGMIGRMTALAGRMLQEGNSEALVRERLIRQYAADRHNGAHS